MPVVTNNLTFSEAIDNAAYSLARLTIAADATAAPDGAMTADKLQEDTQTGSHRIIRNLPTMSDNFLQATSLFVKPAERSWIGFQTKNKANVVSLSYYDATNAVWGTISPNHTVSAASAANGFYRVGAIWNSSTGATTPTLEVYCTTGSGIISHTGVTGNGLYLWGLQHQTDTDTIGPYVATGAAAASGSFYVPAVGLPISRMAVHPLAIHLLGIP